MLLVAAAAAVALAYVAGPAHAVNRTGPFRNGATEINDVTSSLGKLGNMSYAEFSEYLCETQGCCGEHAPVVFVYDRSGQEVEVTDFFGRLPIEIDDNGTNASTCPEWIKTRPQANGAWPRPTLDDKNLPHTGPFPNLTGWHGDRPHGPNINGTRKSPPGARRRGPGFFGLMQRSATVRIAPRGLENPARVPDDVERLVVHNNYQPFLTLHAAKAMMDLVCRTRIEDPARTVVVELWNVLRDARGHMDGPHGHKHRRDHWFPNNNGTENKTESKCPHVFWGADEDGECVPVPEAHMIIVENVALARMTHDGSLRDLGWFIEKQATQKISAGMPATRRLLVDSIVPQLESDIRGDNEILALPLTAETRMLLFNKTTLSNLSLPFPPPHNQGAGWEEVPSMTGFSTWPDYTWASFIDRLAAPIAARYNHSISFYPGMDEEFKLFAVLARSQGSGGGIFTKKQNSSNFEVNKNPAMMLRVANTLERLVRLMEPNFIDQKDPAVQKWLADWPNVDPEIPPFTFSPPTFDRDMVGLALNADRPDFRCSSDIEKALLPGARQYIGASMMAITKKAPNATLAFELLRRMADISLPYIHLLNVGAHKVPPYMEAWRMDYWNQHTHAVDFLSIYTSVPTFHPYTQPPQLDDIEMSKPFRTALVELVAKNQSLLFAAGKASRTLDFLLLRRCEKEDLVADYSIPCDEQTGRKTISFSWRAGPDNTTCRDGNLPVSVEAQCKYVGSRSYAAVTGYILATLGITYALAIGGIFWYMREHKPVRSASPIFCELVILGVVLMLLAGYVRPGPPSRFSATLSIWCLGMGFGLVQSALLIKLWRIQVIFITSKTIRSLQLTDRKLLLPLGLLLCAEALFLLLLTITQPLDPVAVYETVVMDRGHALPDVPFSTMKVQSDAGFILLVAFNVFLVLANCVMSWWIRNVPSGYRETKFILSIAVLLLAVALIVVPVVLWVEDPIAIYLTLVYGLFFICVSIVSLLFLPKILASSERFRKQFGFAPPQADASEASNHARTNLNLDRNENLPSMNDFRNADAMCNGTTDQLAASYDMLTRNQPLEEELEQYRRKVAELTEKLIVMGNFHGGMFKPPQVDIEAPVGSMGRRASVSAVQGVGGGVPTRNALKQAKADGGKRRSVAMHEDMEVFEV